MLVGSGVKGRQHASEVDTCRVARMNEDPRAFRDRFWEHAALCVFFTLHFIPGWVEQGRFCQSKNVIVINVCIYDFIVFICLFWGIDVCVWFLWAI